MSGSDYLRESIGVGSRFIPSAPMGAEGIDQPAPDVDDMARVLIAAWEEAERKPVNASYVATFADMARAALAAVEPLIREREAKAWTASRSAAISDHTRPSPYTCAWTYTPNPYRSAEHREGSR